MEISVQVNEEKFKEVLQKELNAFSKEELHEICREGLVKCMSDINLFKSLFVTSDSRGYWSETYHASDVLKEAAKKVDLSPCFKELEDKANEYVKENGKDIVREIFCDIFMQGLSTSFYQNDKFKADLSSFIYQQTHR